MFLKKELIEGKENELDQSVLTSAVVSSCPSSKEQSDKCIQVNDWPVFSANKPPA